MVTTRHPVLMVLCGAVALAMPLFAPRLAHAADGAPPAQPGALQDATDKAAEVVRLTKEAFSGYTVTVGWSIKQAGLREEKDTTNGDAPVFLPSGSTGRDPLSGDRVGQTQGLWLNLAGPVSFFQGKDRVGWGYNVGFFQTKFDKYESGLDYDVTDVKGGFTGTFVYAMPTVVLVGAPGGRPDIFRGGGQIGVGVVASHFDGKMEVRRSTVFPRNYANDTYKGDGEWRYSPAVFVELNYIVFNHLALSLTDMILQSGGVYYAEMGIKIGYAFGF